MGVYECITHAHTHSRAHTYAHYLSHSMAISAPPVCCSVIKVYSLFAADCFTLYGLSDDVNKWILCHKVTMVSMIAGSETAWYSVLGNERENQRQRRAGVYGASHLDTS